MAGPRPAPTKLRMLKGNPGKRPYNEKEPKPKIELPDPPEHLNEDAQTEWNRIGPELVKLGIMSSLDTVALAAYCEIYARWVEAGTKLKETGLIVKAKNGYPLQNPYLSIQNTCLLQMRTFLCEFGMTPSSRTKIKANPPTNSEDDLLT